MPTGAAEQAIEALDHAVRGRGAATVALTGPPGAGKTTALHVWAARRSGKGRVLVLPHAALPAPEICAWAVGLLETPLDAPPEASLRAAAARVRAETGTPLVVAIDDAEALPLASAHRLAALLAESEDALRLVLVASDQRPQRTLAAMGPALEELRLAQGMSLEETTAYVRAKLERAGRAGEVGRAPFGPEELAFLHRATGGLPGHVEAVAEAFEREARRREPDRGAAPARAEPAKARAFRDPFTSAPDPEGYVARPATERALAELEAAIVGEALAVALVGPSGMGRTLLLRLVAERARTSHRALFMPYPALDADELLRLALALAGESADDDPEAALLALAARTAEEHRTLLLLLDDADSLPDAARERLGALLKRGEGTVRLLVVCRPESLGRGAGDGGLAAQLPGLRAVRLDAPLEPEETEPYLRARLERAGAPGAVHELFRGEAVDALHRASQGIPRELHRHADARLRAEGLVPPFSDFPHAPEAKRRPRRAAGARAPAEAAERRAAREAPRTPRRRRRRRRPFPVALLLALFLALAAGLGAWLAGLGPLEAPAVLRDAAEAGGAAGEEGAPETP